MKFIKRAINRFKKEVNIAVHKVYCTVSIQLQILIYSVHTAVPVDCNI